VAPASDSNFAPPKATAADASQSLRCMFFSFLRMAYRLDDSRSVFHDPAGHRPQFQVRARSRLPRWAARWLGRKNITDPHAVARTYLGTWNEANAARRTALLADGWTRDAAYVDPMGAASGQERIAQLIGSVRDRFPGFEFKLIGQTSGYADFARFAWSFGPAGAEPSIKGSDVVELRDGRIARVIGFLDQVPAGA
jgi:SnoaL-like domain